MHLPFLAASAVLHLSLPLVPRLTLGVLPQVEAASPTAAAAPPAAPAPVVVAPAEDEATFARHYKSARSMLVTGDFAGAASEFAEAARAAENACDRTLAADQQHLAEEWASRGLAFVQRSKLGESGLTAKAVDLRTSDEVVSLYTNAVLFGVGTGAWIDVLTQGQSAGTLVLPPLIVAGATVGGVVALDSGRGLRYGVAQSIVSGMYLGLEEGVLWSLWQATRSGGDWSAQATASLIWTATTAGAVAGGIIAQRVGTTPGRASFVGSAGLWSGVVTGLTASLITGATSSSDSNAATAPLAVAAIGLSAGTLAGLMTAGSVSPSIAHVRFIDLGGLAGFLVGGGLYLAGANNNADVHAFSGFAALGTAAGLATAWYVTRSMPGDDGASEARRSAAIVWNPSVMPAPGGATLGVVGQM
jgi:hypothetical protein